ncbi:hypothetical protein F5B18DRAFT_674643 [Nemania serpens]|nr:hypothetical protein F5B18DRAFT_674643 [Nemania serpens]
MTSNSQTNTLTVPVGSRLSHGIELEMLIAYLKPNDPDPDEAISSTLPPVLRIDPLQALNGRDSISSIEATYEAIERHIRTTLRNHGLRVKQPKSLADQIKPTQPNSYDQWDITQDGSVTEQYDYHRGNIGQYLWYSAEIRSPACWDVPQAYDEIRFVVNLLKSKYRVRVNPTCGFHVHVGNGPQHFTAEVMKRAGAFLFAADPMLSRLHAPWRRVADYSTSVRYKSRLACQDGMGPADAQKIIDYYAEKRGADRVLDPIRVLPWSDRTREADGFQGAANWEQYANARVRDGPHITLSERPLLSPQHSQESTASPSPELTIRGGGSASSSAPAPSNPSSSGVREDNEDGAYYYRRLLALLATTGFRTLCFEGYGHDDPHSLTAEELIDLLVLNQQMELFGNMDVDELSDSGFQKVMVACAPYLESVRTVWKWDPSKNAPRDKDRQSTPALAHPQPRRYNKVNAGAVLGRLSAQAKLWEREENERALRGEGGGSGGSSSYHVGSQNALQPFLHNKIEELMDQPGFPLEELDRMLELWKSEGWGSGSGDQSPRAMSDSSGGSSDYNPPASKALNKSYPSLSESHGKSSSSSSSSSAFVSNTGSSNHRQPSISDDEKPKLLPHNISQLSRSYIERIAPSMNLPPGLEARIVRIPWLPGPGGRPADPGEPHRRGSDECWEGCHNHPVTDTRAGLAAIMLNDNGAGRLNYNLIAYEVGTRANNDIKRTIEFREAGGSLDAEWVVLWAKICVGILRFSRNAPVDEYLDVLERVVGEEERGRRRDDGEDVEEGLYDVCDLLDDMGLYDVCDLLDDMGLFAEATAIRRRERELGPPSAAEGALETKKKFSKDIGLSF